MNIICSVSSLRILKSLSGRSFHFIWQESVSRVLVLLAVFLSVSFCVVWNSASRFISCPPPPRLPSLFLVLPIQ